MLKLLRKPAALFLILTIGFILRCYNLTFPSIGYHNMKENEYLSIAQEMVRTGDYKHIKIYYYDAFGAASIEKGSTQSSLMPYQIIAAWSLSGQNLWGPRMVNVIFGTMSLLVLYGLSRMFFTETRFALTAALIGAIMPIGLFFSRYLMPDSPALFFMLLANFFYVRHIVLRKDLDILLGSAALSCAALYKPSFIIGAVPVLFLLPYGEIFKKGGRWSISAAFALLPYAVLGSALVWMKSNGLWEISSIDTQRFVAVFEPSYWVKHGKAIWWFAHGENFTPVFVLMAAAGCVIAVIKRKGILNRYIIGWIFAALCYGAFYPAELAQINYFQMPFVAFIAIASVYSISWVSQAIKRSLKRDVALILILFMVGDSVYFVYNAMGRMNNTAFIGVDSAGETLRELTGPEERIFLLTHSQGYGIARYANRYVGWPLNLADFIDKEEKFKIRYICFYPADFARMMKAKDPALFDHICRNYHVREIGLTQEPRNVYYVILEKGEGSDPKTFLESYTGPGRVKNIYRIAGNYVFFYVINP